MKISDVFKIELLEEGLSPILYHSCNISVAIDIIKSDKFLLSSAFTTPSDSQVNSGRMFFLSTSRTRTGAYHAKYPSGVLLKLDGRKLMHKYSGIAVDYWGPNFRNANPASFEQEDRVLSDKNSIPNASKYILEMDLIVDESNVTRFKRRYLELISLTKKNGIVLNVYVDNQSWVTGNKAKAISYKEFIDFLRRTADDDTPSSEAYYIRRGMYEKDRKRDGRMGTAETLYYVLTKDVGTVGGGLRKSISRLYDEIRYNNFTRLNADLHNEKTSDRAWVGKLGMEMSRNGLKTLPELYAFAKGKIERER